MTLLMLLAAGWIVLVPLMIGVIIAISVEDGKDGFQAASIVSLIVLSIYTYLTIVSWFAATGIMS